MIHQTAEVSPKAKIGKNVKIWHFSRIREGARIGNNCIIGSNVYIDHNVKIGSNVKIQNNALIYFGSHLEDEVFIGPNVCLTNDKYPRAVAPSGKLKTDKDWKTGKIIVKKGASIGAGSVIVPNVKIGPYSLIAAGSVVTKSVPAHTLVAGNPARFKGYVCTQGHSMTLVKSGKKTNKYFCKICHQNYFLKK